MTPIKKQGNKFVLTIDESLASEAYLQRFLEFLEFRALTQNNRMTKAEAAELANDLSSTWWQTHKESFLAK